VSAKNQKSKLERIVRHLDNERLKKTLELETRRQMLNQADDVRQALDQIDRSQDHIWPLFTGYRVKYRHSLQNQITSLSGDIEALVQDVSNLEKTGRRMSLRLTNIRAANILMEAEVELTELVSRQHSELTSALGKPRGLRFPTFK
jgi:hypothetical protein